MSAPRTQTRADHQGQASARIFSGVASTVVWADGVSVADHNGFLTALAIRELRRSGEPAPEAWWEVVESCRRPEGGFGFWPSGATPAWAPELPPDSDDTSVMLLELFLAGRQSRHRARSLACTTVGVHRLRRTLDPAPPWLRRGMFTTWHRPGSSAAMVDLTAVVNVLALLHRLDLARIPGVVESCAALEHAVRWAGASLPRWQSLSPFYPEPDELARALEHAAECGVRGAGSYAESARAAAPRQHPEIICSRAYGPPVWRSPQLAAIRRRLGQSG